MTGKPTYKVTPEMIEAVILKSISEEQRKKDPHAGPGESFPEDPEHIRAAWDLAGQAAHPDEVRRKVLAYARENGLLDRLPQSAHDWHKSHASDLARKAQGVHQRELMNYAYNRISEWEPEEKRRMIEWAQREGLSGSLPDEAHGFMHQANMPHTHDDDDNPMHHHVVRKAFVAGKAFKVKKAWWDEVQSAAFFEGWVSTPDRDREKDIVEPESFLPAIKSYFEGGAPVSSEHNTAAYPVGHLQRAAIVRDGKVLHEESHPDDAAAFEHFPATGSGVWARGKITEEPAASHIRKGNVRGLSWIGHVKEYEPLPGGGKRFLKVDPWLEATVAAYPVNRKAVIAVAKAFGLEETPQEGSSYGTALVLCTKEPKNMPFDQEALEKLMALAGLAADGKQPTPPAPAPEPVAQKGTISLDEVAALLAKQQTELMNQFSAKVEELVADRVQKAMTLSRGTGVGTKQIVADEQSAIEADPLGYIVKKAQSVKSEDELTHLDKQLMWGIMHAELSRGMRGED